MAWIEAHQQLERHPKLINLCSMTNWTKYEAIGKLIMLWWWALDFAEDGDLSGYQPLQFLGQIDPNFDPNNLYKILQDVNFIEKNGLIHDWLDYAGRYLYSKYHSSNPKKYKEILKKHKVNLRRTYLHTKGNLPNLTNLTIPNQTKKDIPFSFDFIYNQYPSKTGRKSAERYFRASVKTDQDFNDIQAALKNYVSSERVKKGFIQNASTWFNNWRDWINYVEPKKEGEVPDSLKQYIRKDK